MYVKNKNYAVNCNAYKYNTFPKKKLVIKLYNFSEKLIVTEMFAIKN